MRVFPVFPDFFKITGTGGVKLAWILLSDRTRTSWHNSEGRVTIGKKVIVSGQVLHFFACLSLFFRIFSKVPEPGAENWLGYFLAIVPAQVGTVQKVGKIVTFSGQVLHFFVFFPCFSGFFQNFRNRVRKTGLDTS